MTSTKILIIEDEAMLREEIVEWMRLEGFEAHSAADGIQGVSRALEIVPDLVICDITMPKLDGHGVLLELRANPATATIPFIFVTARASHEDMRRGMDLGADDYISKPFTQPELMRAILSRLDKRNAHEHKFQDELHLLQSALEEEQARRMLNTKLVAMFSHDFRNPLASISSSNALLREYGHRMDQERQQVHFQRIDRSVRQLTQMLDDMLIVARLETGNLDFQPERLNFDQFFLAIVEEFRDVHSATHPIVYRSEFFEETAGDPRLLRQIAMNLISNAIKYSPNGGEVVVSLAREGDVAVLTVQDHGIGIPKSDQTRVFESFQRASNTGSIPGTGLGMAIIQQAVELHRGHLELDSQVGLGTTIRVRIPV